MTTSETISILGCGWLGFPLAKQLLTKGYLVKGSTTRQERLAELEAAGVQAFVVKSNNGVWEASRLIEFLTCDILVIAIPPGTKKNPDSPHALEIKQLMKCIQEQSNTIQKVIYISSTSVYKNSNTQVVETEIRNIEDAENKVLAEAESYIQNCVIKDRIILRMGGLTGYDRMLARFFAGKTELQGWNEPVNLVHRDDATGSILYVIEKNIKSDVFNICAPEHPSRKDFYTALCAKLNLPQPQFNTNAFADWKEVSSEKISQLGYVWKYPNPFEFTYA